MTVYSGTWEYASGNGMQVIMDVTWSTVTNTSTNAVATVKIYTNNQYTYSDTQTLTWGGSESPTSLPNVPAGSASFTNNNAAGQVLRRTNTYTYPYTTYGTSPGSVTFTASVSDTYNGVTPSVSSGAIAIPARPVAVPAPPVLTATTASSSQIDLSWTYPDDNGGAITSYTLQASGTSGTTGFTTIGPGGTGRTYSYTGLTKYKQYWFRVLATNSAGNSGYSTVVSATTSATVPGAPTSLVATPDVNSVALSWVAPTDTGGIGLDLANDYVVKRGGTTLGFTGSGTTFTDTGLTPATDYTYTVSAVNSIGSSSDATVSTTTVGGVVNIATATPDTYVKVLPKVCIDITPGAQVWADAQARIWDNSEWKYGI